MEIFYSNFGKFKIFLLIFVKKTSLGGHLDWVSDPNSDPTSLTK